MQTMLYAKAINEIMRSDRLSSVNWDVQQSFDALKKLCDEKIASFKDPNTLVPFIPFANWFIRLLLFMKKAGHDLVHEANLDKDKHSISVYFLVGY